MLSKSRLVGSLLTQHQYSRHQGGQHLVLPAFFCNVSVLGPPVLCTSVCITHGSTCLRSACDTQLPPNAEASAVARAQGLGGAAAAAQADARSITAQCSPPAPPPAAANAVAPANALPECFGLTVQNCCNKGLTASQQCGCTPAM
jgi:hypothetical protein